MKKGLASWLFGFIIILSSFMVSCGEKESSANVTAKSNPVKVLLPTPPDDRQYDAPEIPERDIMKVYANKDNEIMVTAGKDEPITLTVDELGTLRELAKVFITANTPGGVKNDNYPELKSKQDTIIHLNEHGVECYYPAPYSNSVWNNKHVIALLTDRSTKYEVYFKVQEALYGAYNDLRDDFAKRVYGVENPKKQLTQDELELCRRRYVNMILETQSVELLQR